MTSTNQNIQLQYIKIDNNFITGEKHSENEITQPFLLTWNT